LSNPALIGEALIYCVFSSEGKLVGANSFFPSILSYQEKEYRAVQSGDTMVHPDYRGKGIFLKILAFAVQDLKEKGYSSIYGYANGQSYPGFIKFGYHDCGRINMGYRVLNASRLLGRYGITGRLIGGLINLTLNLWQGLSALTQKHAYQVGTADLADRQISDFLEVRNKTIHPSKRFDYLLWKYREKPQGHYETLVVKRAGELVAVVIVRYEISRGQKIAEIVEYAVKEGISQASAICEVLSHLTLEGYALVKVWEPRVQALKKALGKNLFLQRKIELYLVVLPLQGDLSFILEPKAWEVIGGNADTA
jgi:GNAT superfamily N-acetyltransferase